MTTKTVIDKTDHTTSLGHIPQADETESENTQEVRFYYFLRSQK